MGPFSIRGSLIHRLLLCLGLVLIVGCKSSPKKQNVIIITLDTLRADHLPCYGYSKNTAPNLCAIAEQSLLFSDAYSQSSWTLPAHGSIFTGAYAWQHGATQWETPIKDSYPMLAEKLKEDGYRTGAIVSTLFVGKRYGFGRGFDTFKNLGENYSEGAVYAKRISDDAIQWLSEKKQPFFLWLHYYDMHHEFIRHDDTGFQYLPDIPARLSYAEWNKYPTRFGDFPRHWYENLYDGEIAFVDKHLGRVFDQLKAQKLWENTIVIITSDHGEAFKDHNLVGHDNLVYRELTHVPLIAHIPGTGAEKRIDPVETRQIFSTVLDLVGVQKPEGVAASLLEPSEGYAFSGVHNRNPRRRIGVMSKDWHLVYTLDERKYELYSSQDVKEESNVFAQHNVNALTKRLFKQMGVLSHDEDELNELKTLGYISGQPRKDDSEVVEDN